MGGKKKKEFAQLEQTKIKELRYATSQASKEGNGAGEGRPYALVAWPARSHPKEPTRITDSSRVKGVADLGVGVRYLAIALPQIPIQAAEDSGLRRSAIAMVALGRMDQAAESTLRASLFRIDPWLRPKTNAFAALGHNGLVPALPLSREKGNVLLRIGHYTPGVKRSLLLSTTGSPTTGDLSGGGRS
ncbi:hypothetical protein R1flu_010579 [Riccia fluitans]|uniref:Uncharacterized protein n=1 Tax=Riccia fluitans TaxID=41844 RepID=A0ABD1Z9J6_9MARC